MAATTIPGEQETRTLKSDLRESLLKHPDVNALCRESRVSRQSVWRFLRGDRDLSLESVDRLAKVMRLRIVKEWSCKDR